MYFIIMTFLVIVGIIAINQRAESEGIFSALKSIVFLLLTLSYMAISLTGVGAIIGIPLLRCLSKAFSKKI